MLEIRADNDIHWLAIRLEMCNRVQNQRLSVALLCVFVALPFLSLAVDPADTTYDESEAPVVILTLDGEQPEHPTAAVQAQGLASASIPASALYVAHTSRPSHSRQDLLNVLRC